MQKLIGSHRKNHVKSLPNFEVGDLVVYRMQKTSIHPGPRAKNIYAASKGDTYTYFVDKYWVVTELLDTESMMVKTRRGKQREISLEDPNLRKASLWDRFFWQHRFPTFDAHDSDD